ncbi:glycoside hydrolase family 13 protein [Paenibacillus anaericanus]|uniref:Glycoside hydrolase family 13 protein n=1 Tax=Paenibacillus anaericanus TaxID=170367 RepID=A0A433Y4I4_9BACL|nr:glycoside hydrolase family 13 protein [Paenibacillus anaericanus]RUT43324.1 glycoside hydrolase family 13 protein [Paenibacillus anaericanus]
MLLEAIYHRPKGCWSYGYDDQTIHLRIRTKRNDVAEVQVLFGDKCAPWADMQIAQMGVIASDERFDYWQATVHPPYGRLQYGFQLLSGEEQLWFTEKGIHDNPPTEHLGLFEFPFLHAIDIHKPPAWVNEGIFYQIFPDRFANGDTSNDPVTVEQWGSKPTYTSFNGGDLQGVINSLDYLSELGITVIYFNPIFEAPANHKYDTGDYLKIDPHFGDKETLKTLVKACHERGIRVILDGVFNHSGVTFNRYLDVVEKGTESLYYDWFHINEWPLEVKEGIPTYKTFAFEATMPKLNTANSEVKQYFLNVGRYWIEECDIDGWRLDVANEVDHQFWREFRQVVKNAKPDAYILGEVWHDGMAWLEGDQFDGVMNYPVANAILDFMVFHNMDAFTFAAGIGGYLARYPQQVNEAAFNHLDSHDTVRLLTLCKDNKEMMKLAVAFQFTFIGAPSIYYGDEIGLSGHFDPDNRRCMEWELAKQDKDLLLFYKSLIALRKAHPALRKGTFRALTAEKDSSLLVYERAEGDDRLIIIMNAGKEDVAVSLSLPIGEWRDVFSDEIVNEAPSIFQEQLSSYDFRILSSCKLESRTNH